VPWSEASVLLGLLHIELVAGGDSEDVGEVGKTERPACDRGRLLPRLE
jgi:hypothetical protein